MNGASRRWQRLLTAGAALATAVVALGGVNPPAQAAPAAAPWSQTDFNAALSRGNPTESTLTPTTVARAGYRRSLVAAPISGGFGCTAAGVTTPVLSGGRVYAVVNGVLTAYTAATGAVLWRTNPDPYLTTLYPALSVSSGKVLLGEVDCTSASDPGGAVQAFNAATGAAVWRTSLPSALDGMVVSGGYVAASGTTVGSGQATEVLSVADGATVWSKAGGACYQPDAAAILVVAVKVVWSHCNDDGTSADLEADALATGAKVWQRAGAWHLQRGDTDAANGAQIYAADGSGVVRDLNPRTGATRYTLTGAQRVLAVDAPRVYATCGTSVCGYGIAAGGRLWSSRQGAIDLAAEAGGVLYLANGEVLASATGAHLRTLFESPAQALVVGDGRVGVVVEPRLLDLYGLAGS